MKLDDVVSALGLKNGAELAKELGVCRSTISFWRRSGIPAHRRFELAEIISARGGRVPNSLLDPKQALRKRAA